MYGVSKSIILHRIKSGKVTIYRLGVGLPIALSCQDEIDLVKCIKARACAWVIHKDDNC